jgi:hypothetical protein
MRVLITLLLLASPAAAKPEPKITYSTGEGSVQDVVKAIAAQAGLGYEWQKSHDQTQPECQRLLRGLRLKNVPFGKAMEQVLDPVGLRYEVDGGSVVLSRSPAGPLLTYSSGTKTVQYIVIDLAKQVGLGYDFDKSLAQTDPQCRLYRSLRVKRAPFEQAMAKVLNPVRLRYRVEGGKVVLYPR